MATNGELCEWWTDDDVDDNERSWWDDDDEDDKDVGAHDNARAALVRV